MTDRILLWYLTASFVIGFLLLPAAGSAGLPALAAVGAVHVGAVAFAGVRVGRAGAGAGPSASPPLQVVRTPVTLVLAGVAVLLTGAGTGAPIANRPAPFLFNGLCLLAGTVLLTAGLVVLGARLWTAGERTTSALGALAAAVGVGLLAVNILWRVAVIASGGAEAVHRAREQVGAQQWPLTIEPSWTHFTYVWVSLMLLSSAFAVFVATALLAIAARRAGWVGLRTGTVLAVVVSALAAILVVSGFLPPVALLASVLGVPLVSCIPPWTLAVLLLHRAVRGQGPSGSPRLAGDDVTGVVSTA